ASAVRRSRCPRLPRCRRRCPRQPSSPSPQPAQERRMLRQWQRNVRCIRSVRPFGAPRPRSWRLRRRGRFRGRLCLTASRCRMGAAQARRLRRYFGPNPVLHRKRAMNLVDGVLVVVIALSAWGGWRRGLLFAGTDLLALVASVAAAFWLYPHGVRLAEQQHWSLGVWAAPLAFVAAYVLIRIVLGLVLAGLLRAVPRPVHAHGANRALGLLPGFGMGLVNATIVAMVLLALPLSDAFSRTLRESVLANRFAASAQWVEAALRPIFDPALDRTLGRLTIRPGSREVVSLPFTVADPAPRPELE